MNGEKRRKRTLTSFHPVNEKGAEREGHYVPPPAQVEEYWGIVSKLSSVQWTSRFVHSPCVGFVQFKMSDLWLRSVLHKSNDDDTTDVCMHSQDCLLQDKRYSPHRNRTHGKCRLQALHSTDSIGFAWPNEASLSLCHRSTPVERNWIPYIQKTKQRSTDMQQSKKIVNRMLQTYI